MHIKNLLICKKLVIALALSHFMAFPLGMAHETEHSLSRAMIGPAFRARFWDQYHFTAIAEPSVSIMQIDRLSELYSVGLFSFNQSTDISILMRRDLPLDFRISLINAASWYQRDHLILTQAQTTDSPIPLIPNLMHIENLQTYIEALKDKYSRPQRAPRRSETSEFAIANSPMVPGSNLRTGTIQVDEIIILGYLLLLANPDSPSRALNFFEEARLREPRSILNLILLSLAWAQKVHLEVNAFESASPQALIIRDAFLDLVDEILRLAIKNGELDIHPLAISALVETSTAVKGANLSMQNVWTLKYRPKELNFLERTRKSLKAICESFWRAQPRKK